MEAQVSGLGTVHPLLTLGFFSTWFLPVFKRKTSSEMDGLQKREKEIVDYMKNLTYDLVSYLAECLCFAI